MRFQYSLLFIILFNYGANAASISYSVSFPAPQTHYVQVDLTVSDWKGGALDFYMPVWTPGSYLVREFSRNVEQVSVDGVKGVLITNKISKNHWLVKDASAGQIHIHYKVYAFELSVRTSFIDADHANLNGASVFMAVKSLESMPLIVDILPDPSWKVISVPLESVSGNVWKLKAANYDELIDAPFEIGNHKVISFTAAGVHHEIAMVGEAKYDESRLTKDLSRMVEESVKVYGNQPCKRYIFFIQNLGIGNGGGGLEHKNSCTVQTSRWSYLTESGYDGFLGLLVHEYFHLWNGKRLRPAGLGPFDYDEEVYSDLLYVAEGFTAYYEDLLSRRSGFLSESQYLGELAGRMNYIDNTPGNKIQTTAESGTDAWIKYYRSNENSNNATISYYTKGSVIAAMLDFALLGATNGQKGLDSLMKYMYTKYTAQVDRGYTSREFMNACNFISGKNMDDFFNRYVYGTDSISYQQFLDVVGLQLTNIGDRGNTPFLGITTNTDRRITVKSVERNSPAWNDGLNVNDEIIAVNGVRIDDDFNRFLSMYQPGDKFTVLISRNNEIREINTILARDPHAKYVLEPIKNPTEVQRAIYKNWLSLPK